MRRGFLNQPKSKSNPKQPSKPPGLASSVQLSPLAPTTASATFNHTIGDNVLVSHDDDNIKRWAHKLCQSPAAFNSRIDSQYARMADSNFKMIYRNLNFKHFQGVVFADAKILESVPHHFADSPAALENAYKISQTAGKGLGVFATKDIPAGASILVENPIILFPSMTTLKMSISKDKMFQMLFERLDPDVRERALSLWNSKPANVCGKEEGIVRTNGFGLNLVPSESASSHSGTFLDLSRCNHSCSPNTSHEWDLSSFSMSLFAIRPIMCGEEITTEYTKLTEPRQTRRGRLLDMYRFHCECESCNLPDNKAAVSDAARLELGQWSQTAFRKPVEWCKNLSLPDNYLIDKHLRNIALYEQEGIVNIDYTLHMVELAIVYAFLADAKNTRLWGGKARKALKIIRAPSNVVMQFEKCMAPNFNLWGWRITEKAGR